MEVVFDYHAILTNRDGPLLEVEADHRRHAIVEHVIADLKHHAGLAHLPSGKFHQRRLARADRDRLQPGAVDRDRRGARAGHYKTLRQTIIAVPAQVVTSARRLRLRLPAGWPWADDFHTRSHGSRRSPRPGKRLRADRPAATPSRHSQHGSPPRSAARTPPRAAADVIADTPQGTVPATSLHRPRSSKLHGASGLAG